MIARRIQVFGRVQGVFYRASTKNEADNLGLVGWVRNEKNGSVLIEAEGNEVAINQFIEWCKKGPQFANVTSMSVEEIDSLGMIEFEVRY